MDTKEICSKSLSIEGFGVKVVYKYGGKFRLTDLKKPRQTTFIKKYVNQQLNQLVTDGKIPSSQSLGEAKNASMDKISQKTPKRVNQTVETLES